MGVPIQAVLKTTHDATVQSHYNNLFWVYRNNWCYQWIIINRPFDRACCIQTHVRTTCYKGDCTVFIFCLCTQFIMWDWDQIFQHWYRKPWKLISGMQDINIHDMLNYHIFCLWWERHLIYHIFLFMMSKTFNLSYFLFMMGNKS